MVAAPYLPLSRIRISLRARGSPATPEAYAMSPDTAWRRGHGPNGGSGDTGLPSCSARDTVGSTMTHCPQGRTRKLFWRPAPGAAETPKARCVGARRAASVLRSAPSPGTIPGQRRAPGGFRVPLSCSAPYPVLTAPSHAEPGSKALSISNSKTSNGSLMSSLVTTCRFWK